MTKAKTLQFEHGPLLPGEPQETDDYADERLDVVAIESRNAGTAVF